MSSGTGERAWRAWCGHARVRRSKRRIADRVAWSPGRGWGARGGRFGRAVMAKRRSGGKAAPWLSFLVWRGFWGCTCHIKVHGSSFARPEAKVDALLLLPSSCCHSALRAASGSAPDLPHLRARRPAAAACARAYGPCPDPNLLVKRNNPLHAQPGQTVSGLGLSDHERVQTRRRRGGGPRRPIYMSEIGMVIDTVGSVHHRKGRIELLHVRGSISPEQPPAQLVRALARRNASAHPAK